MTSGRHSPTGDEEDTLSLRELGDAVATIRDATTRGYAQARSGSFGGRSFATSVTRSRPNDLGALR